MADKGLWKISVNVGRQLNICFPAEKVMGENGIGFIEKNIKKNIDDLLCIALYPTEKEIVLRFGAAMCMFDVTDGNLKEFSGDYKISLFGHEGLISVLEATEA